ncbi:MAG: SBBP repeat-containing protein, partial [Acidobacteria bacterium]|nr:SBBP repeat-containing protein [Acidobacteriota bacterium]
MSFAGANPRAAGRGENVLPGHSNYFIGSDAHRWVRNVPQYSSVRFEQVYPGVHVRYRASGSNLKYDVTVEPGADPAAVRLVFDTPVSRFDADGSFTVESPAMALRHLKPVAYQEHSGARTRVACGYQRQRDGAIAFEIGNYDRTRTLVIDPELVFLTYTAPGGDDVDVAGAVKIDAGGNVVVGGTTSSPRLPVSGSAVQPAPGGGTDIFVAVFSPNGSLAFLTYLGGTGNDSLGGLAVDAGGTIYVGGSTSSIDFPVTPGAHQVRYGGNGDIFLTVFRPGTAALAYSTFLGDYHTDAVSDLALDGAGNAYLTGLTASGLATPGAYQTVSTGAGFDAFLAQFRRTSAGYRLGCATVLGGDDADVANAVRLDPAGNVWLAGWTRSANMPLTAGALRTTLAGGTDVFVAKVSPDCSALAYSTLVGGQNDDIARTLELLADGSVVIAGQTSSANYPVTAGAILSQVGGGRNGFVTRFHPARSDLIYSTYFVENGEVQASAVTAVGNVYLAGYTARGVPTTAGVVKPRGPDARDAFVANLGSDGRLVWGTYLGGSGSEWADAIALDGRGGVYVAGRTTSADFVSTTLPRSPNDPVDAFVVKLDGNGASMLQSSLLRGTGSSDAAATALAVDDSGSLYIGGQTTIVNYPVTAQAVQKQLVAKKDALILKLSPGGDKVLYATYLGGRDDDAITGLELDGAGNLHIAGQFSQDFPFTVPPDPHVVAGSFLAKIDGTGSRLVYAIESPGRILAVDRATGRAVVAGSSRARCPVTSDAFQPAPASVFDVCVCQFNESGTAVQYATYLGGSGDDGAAGLRIDAAGNIIVAGSTKSSDFPLTPDAFQRLRRGESWTNELFLTVLNPRSRRLEYSTLFGGAGSEYLRGLAVGTDDSLALAGYTYSADFPLTDDAIWKAVNGVSDSSSAPFFLQFSAPPRRLRFASFITASTAVHLTSIAAAARGAWVLAGWTSGQALPATPDALQPRFSGGPADAFLMQIDSAKRVDYSTYLGGSALEYGGPVVTDLLGNVYLAGTTSSPDFPVTPAAVFRARGASASGFVARFEMSPSPTISESGVVSAASPDCGLAPGSLFSIYGHAFSAMASRAESFPLPTSMNDISVLVNSTNAPVTFAGPGQINAQVPYEAVPGTAAIRVKRRTVTGGPAQVTINVAAPCIFLQGDSNRSISVNQDGTLNSPASPAAVASVVTIYFTGQGALSPAVRTGEAAPFDRLSRVTARPVVDVGGRVAEILFIGLTPGLAGVAQANIRVPELPPGEHLLRLVIAGIRSNSPTLSVT